MQNDVSVMERLVDRLHGGQKRQDGSSNALHVKRVRAILVSALAQADEVPKDTSYFICAALGHDLLEDTEVKKDEVVRIAGPDTLRIIEELTNTWGDSHAAPYTAQITSASEEARLIKYADLVDNIFHASYSTHQLGLGWMHDFFLPIVDPMREALEHTTFTKYPKTAALLSDAAALARAHLSESVKSFVDTI